ncbi:cation:proton antiporter [Leifsonia poae]|uniref:cation:proton antiporter n=1 Tax=Leifsonia poae TaxID=110933 RepID=UPI003D67B621
MEILIVCVLAVLAIAAASQASTRMRVASPLILMVLGIVASLVPFIPDLPPIEPEVILAGVLPPLLYSAAVSMPTMDFRRDFRAIGGLSVILVLLSTAVIGALFFWLIPGLDLPVAFALGAIISPTDAVATAIVKRLGVSPRIVSVLEGESLLNDASALVLLRTAIAATAAAVSFWSVLGEFLYSVAIAVAIGVVVGWVNLRVRAKITDVAVATALSFTIPFIASVPAEFLGASGLVAAVTAGLVTGRGAARWLSPSHRLSDERNWRTIELLLEGAVFLIMGLELSAILGDLTGSGTVPQALVLALLAIVATLAVRAVFVGSLLRGLKRTAERSAERKKDVETLQARVDQLTGTEETSDAEASGRERQILRWNADQAKRFRTRAARFLADVDYMQSQPLGFREGTIVVWAGMRGVVTLAAAQTLPTGTPHRSFLILIAFFVATASLVIQGGTLAPLARWLGLTGVQADIKERNRLSQELGETARAALEKSGIDRRALFARNADADASAGENVPDPSPDQEKFLAFRLTMIEAQRTRLLELQKTGTYSSGALTWALKSLDADQLSIELRAPGANSE